MSVAAAEQWDLQRTTPDMAGVVCSECEELLGWFYVSRPYAVMGDGSMVEEPWCLRCSRKAHRGGLLRRLRGWWSR